MMCDLYRIGIGVFVLLRVLDMDSGVIKTWISVGFVLDLNRWTTVQDVPRANINALWGAVNSKLLSPDMLLRSFGSEAAFYWIEVAVA